MRLQKRTVCGSFGCDVLFLKLRNKSALVRTMTMQKDYGDGTRQGCIYAMVRL